MSEEFQPAQEKREYTEEEKIELKKIVMRQFAAGIVPVLLQIHPKMLPKSICEKAYKVAEELIKQGEAL
tara:strand:- start:46 stop:252 length:207 start_codon:yes stop_codon:yes gene_type:complete